MDLNESVFTVDDDTNNLMRNGKIKRKVLPNSGMDTWLKYIVVNLAEMDD